MGRDEGAEERISAFWRSGDLSAAATLTLRAFGPEILGVIRALHRDEDEAREVFGAFAHDLWVGLPGFAWACSMRTWAFVLARSASARHRGKTARRGRVEIAARSSEIEAVAEEVRTGTLPYLRTEARDRFRALREQLSHEEQELLVLRVDRRLDWRDLARVIHDGDGATLDDDVLTREAARLRKRFQLVKDKLREAGRDAGLLGDAGDEG